MPDPDARVEIRDARPADYPAIAELTVAAYRSLRPRLGGYAEELRDVAAHAESARVIVATLDGTVAGAVTYVPGPGPLAEWADPQAAGIRFLAVATWAQRRGIGTDLVNACLEAARAAGRPRLILHTTDLMTTAQRIYHRLGFTRLPELDEEVEPELWLRGYRLELG